MNHRNVFVFLYYFLYQVAKHQSATTFKHAEEFLAGARESFNYAKVQAPSGQLCKTKSGLADMSNEEKVDKHKLITKNFKSNV